MEEFRLPCPVHRIFVVKVEGGNQHPLLQLAQGGVPKEPLQLSTKGFDVIVGASQLAKIDEVVQPGVVEDLRPLLGIKVPYL